MNQTLVPCARQGFTPGYGMLFVRTDYIFSTMRRLAMLAAGFIIMAVIMPIQNSSANKDLDFTIYPDGSTHVSYEIEVDSLSPDFTVNLFGTAIENFVAEDENGFLLSAEIIDNKAIVETFGASNISIDYDNHDLVSKSGKIWSFQIDAPTDYTLLMPKNTVIVGMSTYPINMQTINEKSQLFLPSGSAQISYFFSISSSAQTASVSIDDARAVIEKINNSGIETPLAHSKLLDAVTSYEEGRFADSELFSDAAKNLAIQEEAFALSNPTPESYSSIILIVGALVTGGIVAAIVIKRTKRVTPTTTVTNSQTKLDETKIEYLDKETIFKLKPDLREDDKELVSFLSENGGQAYESQLRKKFLQPRTTMWRAVKRLEREGIIKIEKKELQNLVKLTNHIEGEEV